MSIDQGLQSLPPDKFLEIPRWAINQRHFIISDEETLLHLLQWTRDNEYSLVAITATDNRLLLDRTYKLYYLLSSAHENELVFLEYGLPTPSLKEFPSVAKIFPGALLFEHKIRDLFGLKIQEQQEGELPGFLLHPAAGYPYALAPLSRRCTLKVLKERLQSSFPVSAQVVFQPSALPEGLFVVPVGPIHAGIIEAGHFPFHVAGEVVEGVPVTLGYKHRGVEKLFETHYTLLDGWRLAEKVSGDTSVAHVIAYCQAVEDLAQIKVTPKIHLWRAFLVELERMYNHISDIGLLAVGIAYEKAAAQLAILRELFVHYINRSLSNHRFLRGLNQPGRVNVVPERIPWEEIQPRLRAVLEEALEWGGQLLELPAARERMISTGVLNQQEARNAVGLAARASGWLDYDFRRRHPSGAWCDEGTQKILKQTILAEDEKPTRQVPVYKHDLQGDVFARLAIRIAELETSGRLVQKWFADLQHTSSSDLEVAVEPALEQQPEMAFGLGYTEGWRGAVIYLVFKGPQDTIARCDICDPSFVNWHIFEKAVKRNVAQDKSGELPQENILADFPLINKSFNLSYAGHDL